MEVSSWARGIASVNRPLFDALPKLGTQGDVRGAGDEVVGGVGADLCGGLIEVTSRVRLTGAH